MILIYVFDDRIGNEKRECKEYSKMKHSKEGEYQYQKTHEFSNKNSDHRRKKDEEEYYIAYLIRLWLLI
ncbi:MAG TPA: hypothetical protein DCX82_14615 [Lachnospiraceae bacterium]|jgi:hypothetical protein|nr:hypothetical protein [Lachnospiraceae bacterium]